MMRPFEKKRKIRQQRFEDFIGHYLHLSIEMREPEELFNSSNKYSIVVTGSDQVWNLHSCEISLAEDRYIMPYFLNWVGCSRKVSYATSISQMTADELKPYIKYLKEYAFLSVREKSAANLISATVGKPVREVLDPTLLMDKMSWEKLIQITRLVKEDYVLLYSLKGFKTISKFIKVLKNSKISRNKKIVVLAPFAAVYDKDVLYLPETGPIEFLNLVKNATGVVTDSYHGTLFSINLHTPFFSMGADKGNGGDTRKNEILTKLSLDKCLFDDIDGLLNRDFESIDWAESERRLSKLRLNSIDYLKGCFDENNPVKE